MLTLLLVSMLSMPLYPLNPIQQDTVAVMNMHTSVGFRSPGSVLSVGPELSAKYELLVWHPIIVRGVVGYGYGKTNSTLYPKGSLHSVSGALDAIYYRGSESLKGYVGLGFLYNSYFFSPSQRTSDSLRTEFGITDVGMRSSPGFRLLFGLRLDRKFSIELLVTELRTNFEYTRRVSNQVFSESLREVRLSDIRVNFGYLIALRDW